jgi:hypothetical protein
MKFFDQIGLYTVLHNAYNTVDVRTLRTPLMPVLSSPASSQSEAESRTIGYLIHMEAAGETNRIHQCGLIRA